MTHHVSWLGSGDELIKASNSGPQQWLHKPPFCRPSTYLEVDEDRLGSRYTPTSLSLFVQGRVENLPWPSSCHMRDSTDASQPKKFKSAEMVVSKLRNSSQPKCIRSVKSKKKIKKAEKVKVSLSS